MQPLSLFVTIWRAAGLWLAALLFVLPLHRRTGPVWRAVLGTSACVAARCLLPLLTQRLGPAAAWLPYLASFLLAAAAVALCTSLSVTAVLYCAIWSMMLYYIGDSLIVTAIHTVLAGGGSPQAAMAAALALAAALYLLVGLTLARFMPVNHSYHIGPRQLASAFVLLVLLLLLVHLSRVGWYQEEDWALWVFPLLIEIYCATLLYLQHELFKKSYIQQDLDMLNRLWAQQKAQYSLARRNISLINRKCHELKHQIRAMHAMLGEEKADYLDELEQSVRIYDAIAKTGNEVLDTVLTEKSLVCEASQIQAHCVADGHLLDFMDPVDLYTIFANAMDNAIEHVRGIQTPEHRIIDVLVYAENKLLAIQISNPISGQPSFGPDGLPVSTKPGDGIHGYGLKSVRHAVQKYGGFVTVKVEDGCFHLRILLPVRSQGTPGKPAPQGTF